jgi:putative phosphoribosyl transferase
MLTRLRNRSEAGRALAERLADYVGRDGLLVLALPRGGVPVAVEVARRLGAPLDILLVRKLGVPGQEELAFGAIASGGFRVLNPSVVSACRISGEILAEVTAREHRELERREQAYRSGRPAQEIEGRTVILVDDGVATGASIRVAIQAVRKHGSARLIVAVPVGAASTLDELSEEADEVVTLLAPEDFMAIGEWYDDFGQLTDAEVCAQLAP